MLCFSGEVGVAGRGAGGPPGEPAACATGAPPGARAPAPVRVASGSSLM